jgi:A/G-specific adenine glycosylase
MTRKKVERRALKVLRGFARPPLARKCKTLFPLLLSWFAKNARDLPWRHTKDPYAIWISEVMLQQTQVKTVIPYWRRWMRELPTVQKLADSRLERILKLWEGLGYYTRAKNLRRAARLIVTTHQGQFPHEYGEVLALPGIGRYTAGAVCSIAFDQPTPILDGNVIRVLTRLFGIVKNPKEKQTNATLWKLAEALVLATAHASRITHHASSCSHLNQSLMELGALVCTPKQPKCYQCPVRQHCVALKKGKVQSIPILNERERSTTRRFVAFVAEKRGRFLVRQRPADVVNAQLWEFPNFELLNGADLGQTARNVFGVAPASRTPICTIKHSITRFRITLEVFRAEHPPPNAKLLHAGEWLMLAELMRLPFTGAHRKIVELLSRRASQPK